MERLVGENRFREDLFHRLNVIRVHLPKLADRREDIVQLAKHFLASAAKELEVESKQLSQEAATYLTQLNWPGNVRQLENTCRWLTVMAAGREIQLDDLPPELSGDKENTDSDGHWETLLSQWADREIAMGTERLLEKAAPMFERIMIDAALKHTEGRRRDAAELLGWGRNTITRKIKELSMSEIRPED
jgi:two-component system nitrogen regulation response regulator GlnG